MSRSNVIALIVAAIAAIAVLTAVVARAGGGAADHGRIVQVEYHQQKAVPDFDQGTHVVDDPGRLAELDEALRDSDWDEGDERRGDGGCEGGTLTVMTITYADGTRLHYEGQRCGGGGPAVTQRVDAVIAGWR